MAPATAAHFVSKDKMRNFKAEPDNAIIVFQESERHAFFLTGPPRVSLSFFVPSDKTVDTTRIKPALSETQHSFGVLSDKISNSITASHQIF